MEEKLTPYLGNGKYIFVSYAHKNKDKVYPLIKLLQSKFNVWFDKGIHFTSEWQIDIINHIDNCSLFIYIITEESLASKNCKNEIAYASENNIPFLNVLLDNVELPKEFIFSFGRYQMCKYYEYKDDNDFLSDIIYRTPSIDELLVDNQSSELLFSSIEFPNKSLDFDFSFPLGKNENGQIVFKDYTDFPNALIIGESGTTKTNYALNILCSLTKNKHAFQQNFVVFDSSGYAYALLTKICYMPLPIVTDLKEAKKAIEFLNKETEKRLEILSQNKEFNSISEFNKENLIDCVPNIVIIIDKYKDFVVRFKGFEDRIIKIANQGKKLGIHLFIIENSCKDLPTALIDSCPVQFVFSKDILGQCTFLAPNQKPIPLLTPHLALKDIKLVAEDNTYGLVDDDFEKYNSILKWIKNKEYISGSYLQREFGLGFSRAMSFINRLLDDGYIEKDSEGIKGYKVKK